MIAIEDSVTDTKQLLSHALELISQLHEQMVNEAQALAEQGSPGLITEIAATKKDLVMKLEQFQQQFMHRLAKHDFPATDDGVKAYLQQTQAMDAAPGAVLAQWQELKELSEKCRLLNEQNGMTINLLSLHTQRALQILKGQSTGCATYGRDGSSHQETLSSKLLSV